MKKKYDFDYLIIGSGPAGSAAALNLAKTKKRVALVEDRYFGGTNLNSRDVPFQVALNSAHTYAKVLSMPEFKNQELSFSLPSLASHQLKTIISVGGNDKKIFEQTGIICLHGAANLLDKNTIAIGSQKFTANIIILATGSKLKTTEISGTESVGYHSPESIIKIRRLPKVALVVGGGSTGCEVANFLAELGTKVIILEMADRILPREDEEVSQTITDYFNHQLGIMTLPNCKVVALEQDKLVKRVIFRTDNSEKNVRVDCVVLATGSQPILDYGLENAGVKYKNSGIVVNKLFQTSAKNIYAIGDCIGGDSSTERANYQGTILAANIANKTKNTINYRGFLRRTGTAIEVATVGHNEFDLTKRDLKYKKSIVKLSDTPAGQINNLSYGFVKLLADKNNRILGATIVAPHASLLAEEIALALRHHLTAVEIASTPHVMNSYSFAVKLAAKQLYDKRKAH